MAEEIHRVSIFTGGNEWEENPPPVLSYVQMKEFTEYLSAHIGDRLIKKFKFSAEYENGDDPGCLEIRLVPSLSLQNADNIIQSIKNNFTDEPAFIKVWASRMIAQYR